MEWIWTIIAMAIAGGVTYLITKYGLSGKIGELAGKVEEIQKAVLALYGAIMTAMKPDADGSVRLTPEEVTVIKNALKDLLAIFGINLPV